MSSDFNGYKDFKAFASACREKVYQKICKYLPQKEPQEYYRIVRAYPDRKGQYRRPSYLVLWTLLYGGKEEDALLPAAAQQLSEDYFLSHDDWMDKNTLRRKEKSLHILYGDRYAILAGDHLQTLTWRIAKDGADALESERGKLYFDKFYDMMHITHEGQYFDLRLTHEVKDIEAFSEEDYYQSIHAKTAYYSVYGPMQCGALIAGASREAIQSIEEYGTLAGNAFQIKDDILDCVSEEGVLGKAIGTDVREGTKTLILWYAVQKATRENVEVLKKLKEIYQKEEKTEGEVQYVLDQFQELGAIDFAQKKSEELIQQAMEKFEDLSKDLLESPIKDLARQSIHHTSKRDR